MRIFGTETFKPTFDYEPLELQALKVTEESAELVDAVKHRHDRNDLDPGFGSECVEEELADVIMAALNFAAMLGMDALDVSRIMDDCERRNRRRGRYEV